jgi:hypothetical protein
VSSTGSDFEQIKTYTAQLLDLTPDEVSYITPELLSQPVREISELDAPELPPHEELEEDHSSRLGFAGVVPNRIMYISEIQGGFVPGGLQNITFFANCDRRSRYLMWSNQYSRWERDGTCGVGGGRYVYRFKLWYRA